MQDNPLFNKLQAGSSLFMQGYDGVTDMRNRGMPLGIKGPAQGIENFTDWKGISDKLEEKGLASLEEIQPNKLVFGQKDTTVTPGSMSRFGRNWRIPIPSSDFDIEFADEWSANKVKVYDDMAFVAYDEYTDLHRVDIPLDDAELRQYLFTQFIEFDYDMAVTTTDIVGTLALETTKLPTFDKVSVVDTADSTRRASENVSLDFASYQNTVIRVDLSGTINRGADNVTGDYKQNFPKVIYFVYGGTLKNDMEDVNIPLNRYDLQYDLRSPAINRGILSNAKANSAIDFTVLNQTFDDVTGMTPNLLIDHLLRDEGAVVGKFYLVVDQHESGGFWPDSQSNNYKIDKNTGTIGIQLSIQCNWGQNTESPDNLRDVFPFTKFGPTVLNEGLYYQTVDTTSISLIKIQPVRKCGKVDIYTKKRGIFLSAVNNVITSNGHGLNTNDTIEITGALFDGNQNGSADTHPLNNLKYVRVVDDDTFELFDDEFFETPSFTGNLRTTDGILWTCVSNNFGSIGQSWDYHGTIFSPTGRNGYKFVDPVAEQATDSLANTDQFFTTKRPVAFEDPATSLPDTGSINIKFNSDYSNLVNSNFAKRIDDNIPVAFTGDYDTPLNDTKRAYWDFYPFNCQDKSSESENLFDFFAGSFNPKKTSYWGCRFGCDLDIKFSHMSGDSKVYTLAVGERGSDFSVDIFGVDERETHYRLPYATQPGIDPSIYGTFRRRVIPWNLPHGKTHLITITVDRYNRISDISHENTVFGGGKAIVENDTFDDYREVNPWQYLQQSKFRPQYKELCLSRLISTVADPLSFSESELQQAEQTAILEGNNVTSENLKKKTKYWIRAASIHWLGQGVFDYRREYTTNNIWLREIVASRKTKTVNSDGENGRSRFGGVGFGGPFPPYRRVDRFDEFNEDDERGFLYQFIYPWVDSFGKSVAVANHNNLEVITGETSAGDVATVILSACTVKSNSESTYSWQEPVFATNDTLTEDDTIAKIGQIQASFIYNTSGEYKSFDHMHLNSGGSDCDRLFTNLNTKPDGYRALQSGDQAGFGMPEVIQSCYLSASCLEWVGDKIIWVDQNLYGAHSKVNILKFDDGFSTHETFGRDFIDPRQATASTVVNPAFRVGDGFGIYFKYEDDIFVTNAQSQTNEFGVAVVDYINNDNPLVDRDRLDFIHVYEKRRGAFARTQKISASIDKLDEVKYPLYLKHSYNLLEIPGSVNYNNNTLNSLMWNINFHGRYDLINGKILIKDPLEYSLFSRDFSVSDHEVETSTSSDQMFPYLGIQERSTVGDSSKSLSYSYISPETSEYECRDIGGPRSLFVSNKVPFFFYKLPVENLDMIEELTIEFDMDDEEIFSYFELNGNQTGADETNNIIPRIVLYGRDPRETVIENGPADSGSSLTYPQYTNGLWSKFENISGGGEYFSYDFPGWYRGGAQDLFFYGRLPGSIVDQDGVTSFGTPPPAYLYGGEVNLGDFYDLTVGRGGGTAGEPAWVAPDVYRSLTATEQQRVVPYANIFLPTATADGYRVTLTRDQIKDFIILGDVIKDEDRPTSIVTGFDDTANQYPGTENINYSIAIGFLLTNIIGFNINTSAVVHEEPTPEFNIGPLRYILKSANDDTYIDARYPYSQVVNFYTPTFEGNKYNGTNLEYELRATVKGVSVTLTKTESSQRRYTNKFHKVALFAYDQVPREDVRDFYKTQRTYSEKEVAVYGAFGYDKFLPVPIVEDKNPVISISRHSNSYDQRYMIEGGGSSQYSAKPSLDSETWTIVTPFVSFFESNNSFTLGSHDGGSPDPNQHLGVHFAGVSVPQYANITSAVVKLTSLSTTAPETFDYTVYVEDVADANIPTEFNNHYNATKLQTETVDGQAFNNATTYNFDITSGLQAIVDKVDWSTGNNVNFFLHFDDGSDLSLYPEIDFADYDHATSSFRPEIVIDYTTDHFHSADRPGSLEILNTENVFSNDTEYHIDPDTQNIEYTIPPTGAAIGISNFNYSSMMGGFDLDRDEFLSLTIRNNAAEDSALKLYLDAHEQATNNHDLFINGLYGISDNTTLWTGVKEKKNTMPLFLNYQVDERPLSLFMYEIQPSGDATLFIDAPDIDGSIDLVMGHTPTGKMPLVTFGPLNSNSGIPLVMAAQDSGNMPLYIEGIGRFPSGIPLVTNGILHENSGIPLVLNPGKSGIMPLFLARNLESSGNMPLVMNEPIASYNSGIPLYIARSSNDRSMWTWIRGPREDDRSTQLYIDSQHEYNDDTTLFVDGPFPESKDAPLFIPVNFPSGDMSLYSSSIGIDNSGVSLYIPNTASIMPLHMPYVKNPSTTLWINGFAIETNKGATLFTFDSYHDNDINLVTHVIDNASGNLDLAIDGSLENKYVDHTPLFIGKEIFAENDASLFTYNDIFAMGDNAVFSVPTLNISGSFAAAHGETRPLYINVPESASGVQGIPLFLKVNEPTFGPGGGILQSGEMTLVMDANNDAGVYFKKNKGASLVTVHRPDWASGIPLYINRPHANLAPLYVQALLDSGNISVYTSGANHGIGSMELFITPPEASGLTVFTRGYLE